jgi:streptogramin lyase
MRIPMIVATAVLLTAGAGAANAAPTLDMPYLITAAAVQDPAPQPSQPKGGDVKIDVDLDDDGAVWYTDPLWIVLGAAAVIVVVALVAAAARGGGGGTTVIR